jgi:hypothetical protein
MATATKTVTELPAWKALLAHFQKVGRLHLREAAHKAAPQPSARQRNYCTRRRAAPLALLRSNGAVGKCSSIS